MAAGEAGNVHVGVRFFPGFLLSFLLVEINDFLGLGFRFARSLDRRGIYIVTPYIAGLAFVFYRNSIAFENRNSTKKNKHRNYSMQFD